LGWPAKRLERLQRSGKLGAQPPAPLGATVKKSLAFFDDRKAFIRLALQPAAE